MTNEEKGLLIAYLADAGEIDPEGDVEAQFLDWYRVRGDNISGEVHYKAILDAARVRQRAFEEGRLPAYPRPRRRWAGMSWQPSPGCTVSWATSAKGRVKS